MLYRNKDLERFLCLLSLLTELYVSIYIHVTKKDTQSNRSIVFINIPPFEKETGCLLFYTCQSARPLVVAMKLGRLMTMPTVLKFENLGYACP
mgnify:CR=1 FL=1